MSLEILIGVAQEFGKNLGVIKLGEMVAFSSKIVLLLLLDMVVRDLKGKVAVWVCRVVVLSIVWLWKGRDMLSVSMAWLCKSRLLNLEWDGKMFVVLLCECQEQ